MSNSEIDWIQGNKFCSLQNENIIFCSTHEVNNFFKKCQKEKPFILISHNSDGYITDNPRPINTLKTHHHADIRLIPKNLHKWYGCMIESKHEKISSIPIGVENNEHFGNKGEIIKEINKYKIEKKNDKLIYVNFKISNNYLERIQAYNAIKNSNFCTFTDKMFTEQQINPPKEPFPFVNKENYEKFAYEVKSHKFVLCPTGNGLESHRLWETLYLGSIPIVRRNINYSFYEDKLPILMIDNWEEITDKLLEEKYIEIENKQKNFYYKLEMLNFSFWKDLIEKEYKNVLQNKF